MHAARIVRRLFALPRRHPRLPAVPLEIVDLSWPRPGEITLITGGSGGGKSRLLAALRERAGPSHPANTSTHEPSGVRPRVIWIEPTRLPLGDACVVDRVCDELDPAGRRGANGANRSSARPAESRIEAALELLSRVGLAEAWTYLQTPAELSDGQRWRLLLALAVARGLHSPADAGVDAGVDVDAHLQANVAHRDVRVAPSRPKTPTPRGGVASATLSDQPATQPKAAEATPPPPGLGTAPTPHAPCDEPPVITIIAIDEFAALLDRVTARVVARALRRLIDRPGRPRLAAIVATSHDDLRAALSPDRVVVADFGTYTFEDPGAPDGTTQNFSLSNVSATNRNVLTSRGSHASDAGI